jgi:cytochrome c biogenesis protein CcdA/thiol-disulfide isomerase/thioredoxin
MSVVVGFAFLAGILTILGPCTLPVVPLVLGGAASGGRRKVAGLFVGFGASFVGVTVVAAAFLGSLGLSTATVRLGAVAILGLAGLTLAIPRLGDWVAGRVPARAVRIGAAGDGFVAGVAVGAGIGLVWAPCVGPIMAAVIAAAAVSGPSLATLTIALGYVAGAVLPLAAIARWGRRATSAMEGRPGRRLRRGFGVAMTASALIVITGLDVPLQAGLTAALPSGISAALFAVEQQPAVQEELTMLRPASSDAHPSVPLEDFGPAPELTGITAWINSPPTTLAALRGKVVLVHFWTFGCINCIHVQPYVKAWFDRYAGDGFVVLGVHTPELSFERDVANVRDAVAKEGVRFPVAFDPDYATWNAYRNSYWPAFYFVDKAGRIRHAHFGEGDYDGSEAVIRELLAEPGPA